MATSQGSGTASDAVVVTEDNGEAAEADARAEAIAAADADVAAAEKKVERQKAHLAGAEQALANALAAREGV
jgi:hypothetical protein